MTNSRDQTSDLFGAREGEKSVEAPLAERLRPREFADFVGQDDITAPDRPLRRTRTRYPRERRHGAIACRRLRDA